MKKVKIFASVAAMVMLAAVVFSFAACGPALDGTYKFDEVVDTEYGGQTLHIPYHWTLVLEGDAYTLTMVCDIGGGFSTVYEYVGTYTVADGTEADVVLGAPTEMWQPTYYQDADGNFVEDTATEPVKVEGETFTQMSASIDGLTWTLDTEKGTMTRAE